MKNFKMFPAFVFAAVIFVQSTGCSSSNSVTQKDKEQINPKSNWTLKDHLRRASGVRLTGSGDNTRVIIRGVRSIASPTNQPLFVIDGQKAGRNFSNVNGLLSEGEINSIEVLPPSQSSMYGLEGNFGVILIHTED